MKRAFRNALRYYVCPEKNAMYFEQFYLGCLAHASYMFGSDGEAAVVDPQRDVDIYIEAAARQGLQIRYIFETHLHADFVSGHKELAARTGANIYVGKPAEAIYPHIGCGRWLGDSGRPMSGQGACDARPHAREPLPAAHRRRQISDSLRSSHRRHSFHRRCRTA